MLETRKINLVLFFITGTDEEGEPIESRVTVSNLRVDLTANEIWELVTVFRNLVKFPLSDAQIVSTQIIHPTN